MSRLPLRQTTRRNDYPTSDGKPMAETDQHRDLMIDLIATLRSFYAAQSRVYVSGNLLMFYEQGKGRKHVSPDVFVVRGVANHQRENYLIWEEGHAPRFVIELTSRSTRKEDQVKKKTLYQDVLKVREYFLFDPLDDYLKPSLQGWRLRNGLYQPIQPIEGRLPSQTTGLHLERAGSVLRLWNPQTLSWLQTPQESLQAEALARHEQTQARQEQTQAGQIAEQSQQEAERKAADAQAEIQRLRRLLGLQQPPADPT